ncbi:hemopexin repeat-containing protein [Saccharothrix yanglingensis]|uniref:hemopexin repeat-containing protein n=1 Tax=Saccharothrix yanglingensis TaxID=659496 RepID=UPI0027D2E9E4|nr:hemopexin repeat-containing protein [Saccharothrix yanglingensis]
MPTYEQLFGALDFRAVDEGRSVYSPAAYLADLLELIDDNFTGDPLTGPDRRPDIATIPLDGEHAYTELPYLDVVNRVLAAVIGPDAHAELKRLRFPFALPFDLDREKVRRHLRHFRIGPVELYELFARRPERDVVAREFLGLSADDVALVTTVVTDPADLLATFYGGDGSFADLEDARSFVRATRLTATELDALVTSGADAFVHQGGPRVTLDPAGRKLVWGDGSAPVPPEWFERVSRFVRLARRTGLTPTETDVVLRRCCGNRIDLAALRVLAVVVHLHRAMDLPVDVVASLVGPIDGDLFERVFNEPFAAERTVIAGPATPPADGVRVLTASGDFLAPRNQEYRVRVSRAVGLSEADLAVTVRRVRQRYSGTVAGSGPFDHDGIGLDALSLLHRVGRLTRALDVTATELFGVLDALANDPLSLHASAFGGLLDTGPQTSDPYLLLEARDVGSGLCLAQLLLGVVRWMRALGVDSAELGDVLGGTPPGEVDEEWDAVRGRLTEKLDEVALTPDLFVSERFGQRAAQVLHDVLTQSDGVVAQDHRVLRLDPALVGTAAYDAVTDLSDITEEDFRGLGLAAPLAGKVFTNLVLTGLLDSSGTLVDDRLPTTVARFRLASDFTAVRERLFALLAECGAAEPAALYPSDLAALGGLTDDQRAELYDNLVVLGHLDPSGAILAPDFFQAPGNVAGFAVTVPLDAVAPEVFDLLRALVERARTEPVAVDPEIFADLPLTPGQRDDLLESLRFNGYVDGEDNYVDPAALARLTLDGFGLAVTFHPHRAAVLRAVQDQLAAARAAVLTVDAEGFGEIADHAAARAAAEALAGAYLDDNAVPDEIRNFFADPDNVVSLAGSPWERLFSAGDLATITHRIATVLTEQRPYRFDLDAIAELGFDADETTRLVAILVARGDLHDDLSVPEDRLAWFATPSNSLGYTLPDLEDYATDVFYLLHTAARELVAGVEEVTAALSAQATVQRDALLEVLADATGQRTATVEALCTGVCGSVAGAFDVLPAAGSAGRRAYHRIRRFALLVARLGLDATGVGVVFHDQDLAGKFPEPLVLPTGADRIDALLESADGNRYLFRGNAWWAYPEGAEIPIGPPRPLAELSPRFAGLVGVDAAFTDAQGAEWLIGHDAAGSHAFTRAPGAGHWDRGTQVWGKVRNTFDHEPARIDSAFVDAEGRTYLFRGDQYVRYSGSDHTFVDEGYPRAIGEWWEGEGRHTPLPERFRTSVDASFQDRDGTTHLFAGDRSLAVGDVLGDRPTAEVWGRVRNVLADTGRIDAGFAEASSVVLFSGNQVVRYSDSIENDGVLVDEGYPRSIESHLAGVPVGFDGALDAAFAEPSGVVHLFKDGRTVALEPIGAAAVTPARPGATADRWGVLEPVLTGGVVDSAFVGLDGMTYLFSGGKYLRYSGADYSAVDLGYPRRIAPDWGGLRSVGASFVLDGATHLFGAGGLLFDLPVEHEPDLAAGTVSRALRDLLQERGIGVGVDTRVTGAAPEWRLQAEHGIRLVLRRATDRIEVHADPDQDVQYHVRYSTRAYAVPDGGYPRPLAENWWNLPDGGFTTVDAVFTGRDDRTYLFSGDLYVVFDNKRRWWSEPRPLGDRWDSLPFDHVDAAFVGKDGKTYVFSGTRYARYTGNDHTGVDDRYPATNAAFWGNVANGIARHGRVDATLVLDSATYLFSGNQYVRYDGADLTTVADGYPRSIEALWHEPRFAGLPAPLTGPVEAAFADRRTTYLLVDGRWHAVSDAPHRRYPGFGDVRCAFVEDGAVLVEEAAGWQRYSALEGATVTKTPVRPRVLRAVPAGFRTGLDAVLRGADGNTYLFKGSACFDVRLNREYPLAEDWGRGRNTIAQDNRVDAAFVGRDGRTYVFSGDQFVVYEGTRVVDAEIVGEPRPIAEHWAGLTSVTLAYVRGDRTYVFEKPDAAGVQRYLVFSGTGYTRPDQGYPLRADATFWDVPADLRPDGFTAPDAVLFEGENMLVLTGDRYLVRHEVTGAWSPARPVSRLWPGVERDWPAAVTAAFTGPDAATYLFFPDRFTRVAAGAVAAPRPIRDAWGRSRNNFVSGGGRVDAAFVASGNTTFLFSGDQYVRYTGTAYRHADPGYPKLIADNLRHEDAFANLPDSFEDAVAARIEAGAGAVIDAVVANRRTAHLFVGGECHVVSRTATATYDVAELGLGRVRNTLAEQGRVDAALVDDGRTFLFSGDQYVRYSGGDLSFVDEGYPRAIETALPGELGIGTLPEQMRDGVDAAFRGADGGVRLFAGPHWIDVRRPDVRPVAGVWGRVRNAFTDNPGVDAAFVAPAGELYVFRDGQYARYSGDDRTHVDDGFPRTVRDDWGDLPAGFEERLDIAFVLDGRTYLGRGDQYVRYSGDGYGRIDRTYPQAFHRRWSAWSDYRFEDLRAITRFAGLARAHDGLAEFVATGPGTFTDPYLRLAEIMGWDVEDVRWLVRRRALRTGTPDDDRVELETMLKLVDVFTAAEALGAGPAAVFDVWSGLHGERPSDAATAVLLHDLLARRHGPQDWAVLSRQVHDEFAVVERDALVAAVLGKTGADTSRELFEQLLIDVDMGSRGTTSPIREAIAATQFFLHRYFLDLEDVTHPGGSDGQVRDRLRTWWTWMRNYRVWEANRKVFLYPENYLRPELRDRKTPAFEALEADLLQGEVTPASVERAYKRYLDEYTEVSRLAIAGGHVYTAGSDDTRDLVLFGRTRTEPRRFYYRRARFRSADKLTGSWEPWLKVDVQIDADEVHPVHAFNRVFVFWTTVESVPPATPATTTLATRDQGDSQQVTAPPATEQVKIHYSFYNLNGEWVPAQTLAMDTRGDGTIHDVRLAVEVAGGHADDPQSIAVTCTYSVITTQPGEDGAAPTPTRSTHVQASALTAELVEEVLPVPALRAGADVVAATDPLREVLAQAEIDAVAGADPANRPRVVPFTSPTGADYGPWFSIDHKGGSFLCRPAVVAPAEPVVPRPQTDLGLTGWTRVDAAVELPGGTRYFFDNQAHRHVAVTRGRPGDGGTIADRWGRRTTNLTRTGLVDAVLHRRDRDGERTYVFSGGQYFRYSGAFGALDPRYPKDLLTNDENFPRWGRIDAAFTDLNDTEWFYTAAGGGRIERGGSPGTPATALFGGRSGLTRFDSAIVDADRQLTFVFTGDEYVRYSGNHYQAPDEGHAHKISESGENFPKWAKIGAALRVRGTSWYFNDATLTCSQVEVEQPGEGRPHRKPKVVETSWPSRDLGRGVTTGGLATVDSAYVDGTFLYLTSGAQVVRYTLPGQGGQVPETVDEGYPKPLSQPITAVFRRGPHRYAFSGAYYARLTSGLTDVTGFAPIEGNWGDLPENFAEVTGVLDSESDHRLYLFVGENHLGYPSTTTVPRPFERAALPIEVVRLTTSTAAQLNQRLLGGGVAALLAPAGQELDERPAFRTDRSDRNTIQVRDDRVVANRLPAGAHLDFQSANGIYYWEIFFHAPVLIAQALNDAQRFADARQWYEYVFDPTEPDRYWRFLPFLAVDLAALADRSRRDLAELAGTLAAAGFDEPAGLAAELDEVLADLERLTPGFRENRPLDGAELAVLDRLASSRLHVLLADAVTAAKARITPRIREPKRSLWQGVVRAVEQLQERTALVADLQRYYDLVGDRDSLIDAYRGDPFDPHAIADLRPVAYRRAVVMAYIDNLLDWGDMLFRQHTGESVDEARMLYIFAWDLLGLRPELPGRLPLTPSRTYRELDDEPGELDLLAELTGGGSLLEGPGGVHAGVANRYFRIPDNSAFTAYWDRVEDRLRKIRQSLNILGISQPLPLFEPPIDPMDLVRSVAAGVGVEQAVAAGAAAAVPHYRFEATFRRAQDLADRLRQLGGDLLSVLERRDAEELGLLHNRQEGVILEMTQAIRDAQVEAAAATVRELQASREAANQRIAHYQQLITTGITPLEQAQIGIMGAAAALHLTSGVLKVAAAIAHAVPQATIGPFSIGSTWGGHHLGNVLDKGSEMPQVLGEGLTVTGELLGVRAEQERTHQEWEFQLANATGDLAQINHQVAAAEQQLAVARREAEVLAREIDHNRAVGALLKDKFTSVELYGWMASRLSGLYFQAYSLAYDTAKAAERALRFERGLGDAEAAVIRPVHWDSRRAGLLAGDSLGVDLDRLNQVYADTGARGLEITKQVSLLELDPAAALRLAASGSCEFTLTEELFDRDFPGHFRRQVRTVTVTFLDDNGEAVQPNATLTQVGHKTVLEPDPKAVRHLLDPKEPLPDTVRGDWRASQQIALSQPGEQENNGLFELRYDDTRYLPFEGTGAVSTWRLELNGRRTTGLRDVLLTVRYTAAQGGEVFANAVKGMLKPYPTARFLDVATEFPDEWQEFVEGDGAELTLPITGDLLPGLTGRQVIGIYPRYGTVDGSAPRLTVNGDRAMALTEGKLLLTPDLRVDGDGWTFVLDGDKEALTGLGLVLAYRASVA